MTCLNELVDYSNDLLEINGVQDYCPNGLQVEGKSEVKRLVAGVTACQSLIDAAVEKKADVLLVHHGFFWKGESPEVIGIKRRRLKTLLEHNVSLLAYHLPLDQHRVYGNNACLATQLGFVVDGQDTQSLLWIGQLAAPLSAEALSQHIGRRLLRPPLHIAAPSSTIQTIGWCSGAAQSYIDRAVDLGLDAYLSGEISEQTVHQARESGIHYYAAGHHATERYGVQALGKHLAQYFDLSFEFIDVDNPV